MSSKLPISTARYQKTGGIAINLADSIVVIGGSAVFAAFSGDVDQRYVHLVRPLLLSFGSLLSFCLTFAPAQNLFYQVACGEALKIEEGKPLPVIKDRSTSCRNFCIRTCLKLYLSHLSFCWLVL